MAGAALDWTSLPRGSIIVDVGGGIGSTSMLLASAFSSSEGEDLGLKFIIQDRRVVVEMGEKVTCSFLLRRETRLMIVIITFVGVEGKVSRFSGLWNSYLPG